jgi:hypothetical protein
MPHSTANIEKDKWNIYNFCKRFLDYYLPVSVCSGFPHLMHGNIFAYSIFYNITHMEISKDQFPIVIQAFEITNNREFFVAEQVVNSQAEVQTFSTRYAGKVIKARALNSTEVGQTNTRYSRKRKSSAGTIVLIILIILIILIAIGYYTGWIQRTFGMGT